MKNILYSILLISSICSAQFTVTDLDGNSIENNSEIVFNSVANSEAELKFKTLNTSTTTLDIRVRCLSITNAVGTGFQLCYGGLCYDNIEVGGTYPDFQNIIAPGQDNGNADYFKNNFAGDGTSDQIYLFRVFARDLDGNPVGETVNFTYRYSPNLSFNSFEQLSNLGINLKNTVSNDIFEVESSIQGSVDVFSLTGQKLLSRDFQQESFSLDLSPLNASYYLLVFTNKNGGSATIKVLKK